MYYSYFRYSSSKLVHLFVLHCFLYWTSSNCVNIVISTLNFISRINLLPYFHLLLFVQELYSKETGVCIISPHNTMHSLSWPTLALLQVTLLPGYPAWGRSCVLKSDWWWWRGGGCGCFRVNHVIMVKHHRPWSKHVRQCLVASDHVWQWKIAKGPEPFFSGPCFGYRYVSWSIKHCQRRT